MKKQKGITLIALIITIIVMLILVGVTVTTAINGGLFEKARIGAKGTQKEVDREKLNMAVAFAYDETTGKIDKAKLIQELGDGWIVTESEGTYLCENERTGNKFKVTAGGEITDEEIENEDKLIINCKILESVVDGKTTKMIYFIPEGGFDYKKEFCEFASTLTGEQTITSVEDGWKKIAEQEEITPEEMVKALNSDRGLTGENELSRDEWTRLYALMNKLQNNKATIKLNGRNIGEASTFCTVFESEDTKLEKTPVKVTVTVTEDGEEKVKTWEINNPIDVIKPGDNFEQDGTYYTVLYKDNNHGLQLISNKVYRHTISYYFAEEGYDMLNKLNAACKNDINIKNYAEKIKNVGGPFDDPTKYPDCWPADNYYLEDCEQMNALGIIMPTDSGSAKSYILGSRIVKTNEGNTIYGLRMVSAAGEYGDNVYTEIPSETTGYIRSVDLTLRPVVKINSDYYDSIAFKSVDENIATYTFIK
ncbi:MAG: hypothetical protein U0M00_04255 [Clostridia bacterium]|nr:hypothetical protein [Clostridia bacterium]